MISLSNSLLLSNSIPHLPNEIINHILSYRPRHPIDIIMRSLIDYGYKNPNEPFTEGWKVPTFSSKSSDYYSFLHWFFLYRRISMFRSEKGFCWTPSRLIVDDHVFRNISTYYGWKPTFVK